MNRRLHHIHTSIDDHGYQIKELQARSARLEQDLELRAQALTVQEEEEVLQPLKQELHHRLLQADELDAMLLEAQRELQAAEEELQVELLLSQTCPQQHRPRPPFSVAVDPGPESEANMVHSYLFNT